MFIIGIFLSNFLMTDSKIFLPYNFSAFDNKFHLAFVDILKAFSTNEVSIVFDNHTDADYLQIFKNELFENVQLIQHYNVSTVNLQENYFQQLEKTYKSFETMYTLFLCNNKLSEHLLLEIQDRNLIRRNLVYIFYWGKENIDRFILRSLHEVMKTVIITNPRFNVFRIYYNQATSHMKHHLTLVNWWIEKIGLYQHPTLPKASKVFKDFKGKIFQVPVLHKPPWHFVRYNNNTIEVIGGRDDKLLALLARKLNFGYEYFDPPDRSQGTSFADNQSFDGVLGLLWRRENDFFLGDVAITVDRYDAVEFSFLTLSDSGAFVTHAPSKLNEALALVRPFHWQVWPAVGIVVIVAGPVLYLLISMPNKWQPRFLVRSDARLLFDCIWFTTTLFLKQSAKEPSKTFKARFYMLIISVSATYVLGGMYSANLTSLLARPGREKAISTLPQLEKAMRKGGYKLLVEKHSSSYGLLENGTGIYGRLWKLMKMNQESYVVDSVEEGVKIVKYSHHTALMAGRETLFFDVQRFGMANFHLSKKLNTVYSAIAFQLGCPYLENINNILMTVFESGILSKMTEYEYEKLGKQQSEEHKDKINFQNKQKEAKEKQKQEKNDKLQPINIKMVQGSFYILIIGYGVSGIVLYFEIWLHRYAKIKKLKRKNKVSKYHYCMKNFKKYLKKKYLYFKLRVRMRFNESIIRTFDYLD